MRVGVANLTVLLSRQNADIRQTVVLPGSSPSLQVCRRVDVMKLLFVVLGQRHLDIDYPTSDQAFRVVCRQREYERSRYRVVGPKLKLRPTLVIGDHAEIARYSTCRLHE